MNNTKYEVRPVVGYEGLYSISNTGQVFSHKFSGGNKTKQLRPAKNNKGYFTVNLAQDGKIKQHLIHRLVLEAFVPNPENKAECDHIDTNPTNNHISNLRWCTHKENHNNPLTRKKMSESTKDKTIYKFRNKETSEEFVGTRYNFINKYALNQGAISRLVNGKRKSHKGWILF